jgi:ketosteroid isomerase-like protein
MSQENVERLNAVMDAVNTRQAEALQALLAPDAQIVPIRAALEDVMYSGPKAAEDWFAALSESWEEMRAEVHEFRDAGDRVVALGRLYGRGRTSGADFDVEAASVAEFRDGFVTRLHMYRSVAEALADAGLSD